MRRILVVDDSRGVRQKLEACLQPWGFEVQHAENGAKALALLRAQPADLVFLDINMPVLDGPSLLRIMRSQGMVTPVVLVTSGATTPLIASAIKLGAAEFVSKPFTPERIREVVARMLRLDLRSLPQYRPRVLLQCAEESFAQSLRGLLPDHVEIDAAPLLADALELAERKAYGLVIVDAGVLEAAAPLRARQPCAGIFGVMAGRKESAPVAEPSDGPLDGSLPLELDPATANEFLYDNFLRPLVFVEGGVLRASGYEGPSRHLWAYFRQLGRVLGARAEREAAVTADVSIDLRRAPAHEGIAGVIRSINGRLDLLGAAAAFALTPEQQAVLQKTEDHERVVLLDLSGT